MRHTLGLAFITMALLLLPLPLPIMAADEPPEDSDSPPGGSSSESAVSLRPASAKTLTRADTAFADARNILSQENSCSSFFGGADNAVAVLDGLIRRIKLQGLPDKYVGIRMTGDAMLYISHLTGYQYRLFKKVIINTNGPFYNSGNGFSPMPRCGSFSPNTREARVLMLLHEMGHLIKGANGEWLLPDDGGSYQRSFDNTRIVEAKCMSQIRALQINEGLARKSVDAGDAGHKR